jgi:branched-chain amino acid transport system substrate-binding protein
MLPLKFKALPIFLVLVILGAPGVLLVRSAIQTDSSLTIDPAQNAPRLCPLGAVAPDAPVVRIGAAVSVTGQFGTEGTDVRNGYNVWLDWVNNEYGGICANGVPHRAELILYDDQSNSETVEALVEHLIVIDEVDFVLGPYTSDLTEVASVVTERENILMVEGNGASEVLFNRGFQNLFGILTPASFYTRSGIELAHALGAKTAIVFYEDTTFATSVAEGAGYWLREQGYDILTIESYPRGVTDLTAMFEEFRTLDPDLFVGGGHFNDAELFVRTAVATGFCPDAFLITVGPSSPVFVERLGALSHYVWGATQWQPTMPLEDAWFGSATDYAARYVAQYQISPSYQAAESTAAALVLQLAIEAANSTNTEDVRQALHEMDITTFYGPIHFDETGKNIAKPMATVQIQPDDTIRVIAPSDAAEITPVWPSPACENSSQ